MTRAQRPLPLASQQSFASSNFDEIESIYARMVSPMRLERTRRQRAFAWRTNYAALGDVSVMAHEITGALAATSENAANLVYVSLPIAMAPAQTWVERELVELVPGKRGAVVPPWIPGRFANPDPGHAAVNLSFAQDALDRAITTLTGKSLRDKVRFASSFDMTTPASRAFMRLLQFVMSELDEPALSPMVIERLSEALLFQLLHSQPHNHSALLADPEPADTAQVRKVADYLASLGAEPVRMTDLTRLTGTSARSIQAGFRKHRGCTPMEFLRATRLDRARAMLRVNDVLSVDEVAKACGFHHPGRFSAYYRARFGETPLATQRRRKATSSRA
jgi:AraC-like DNA-binding protein